MKKLIILIAVAAALFTGVFVLRSLNIGTSAIWELSNGGKWLLPLVSIAALIDSINPCAFSILLLTIAFLFNLGRLRSSILSIGGFYIAGILVVYMLIGLGILQVLHIFDTPHFMAKVGASLLIALGGINLINYFFPAFPIKLKIPRVAHEKISLLMEKATLPAAFALGVLVGLCEFPCTGGPYLMVLGLLHDQATFLSGLGYLFFYNAIFVLPLVIILLIASNGVLLERVRDWQRSAAGKERLWGGVAMVLLGALIFLF